VAQNTKQKFLYLCKSTYLDMQTILRKTKIHNNPKRAKGQLILQRPDKQNQY
jgi:hypothetical protein